MGQTIIEEEKRKNRRENIGLFSCANNIESRRHKESKGGAKYQAIKFLSNQPENRRKECIEAT